MAEQDRAPASSLASATDPREAERIARKDFWKVSLQTLADTAMRSLLGYWQGEREANPPPPPILRTRIRPPGAIAEADFRQRCTSTGACGRACPFQSLAPDDAGRPWLWDPAGHPCYMCDGFPCIAACQSGALSFRDRARQSIGVAEIRADLCRAQRDPPCTACSDACRDAGAIVRVGDRLAVDPLHCTGCGLCVGPCPAPGALAVRPR